MDRGNSKHGPRLDEEMAREVRGTVQGVAGSRAEEWREPEPAGEDQPEATGVPAGDRRAGAPQGMTDQEVEQRSRLGRYLELSALPADREHLRHTAEKNQAPDDVIDALNRLPAGRTYETVSEVWATLGHANESTRW
ncbi:DUF2795 domain-containing protein [Phytohabitans kaempferiae]|uniref:DUF2795 domain-containing protein n=1 Tax=Phytohabitans kaempferiae TaxID=1620943 RepID=A0ABV6LX19_9ACTN